MIGVGQGDLAIFVMGGSGRVEIMVKINYSDTAGQYKEGKSGESVKYGSDPHTDTHFCGKKHLHKPCDFYIRDIAHVISFTFY